MKDLIPESRRGIICPVHDKQGLSDREYQQQLAQPEKPWVCPVRDCPAKLGSVSWDDFRWES